MNTATITFHSSHNYGSMLQAYAFQQFLFSLGVDNEIINLRIPESRQLYPYPSFNKYSLPRRLLHVFDVFERRCKYNLFESFLSSELSLTKKEYEDASSIIELNGLYDCFISGGDQIWNTRCLDWSPAFFLPQITSKRISYAVSLGKTPENSFHSKELISRISSQLAQYDRISVRDERSAKVLSQSFGICPEINIDTAFLLSSKEWSDRLAKSTINHIPYKFLFIYSPFSDSLCNYIGSEIGRYMHLKAVLTTACPFGERSKYKNLRMKQKTGPWEFLWFVNHSEFVLCTSYHAVIFSMIFHKPFFFLDTKNDSRVHHLLDMVGMSDRIVTPENYVSKMPEAYDISFEESDRIISEEREKSRAYLVKALGLTQ